MNTHGAFAVDVEVAYIKTYLKRKTQETLEVLSTIASGCTENTSQAAQGLKKSYEENAI